MKYFVTGGAGFIGSHAEVMRSRRKPRALRLMVGDHCQIDAE